MEANPGCTDTEFVKGDYDLPDVPWAKCNRASFTGRIWCDLFGEKYRPIAAAPGPHGGCTVDNRVEHMEKYEMNALLVGTRLPTPCSFEQRVDLSFIEWRVRCNVFDAFVVLGPDGLPRDNTPEAAAMLAYLQSPQPLTFGIPWTRTGDGFPDSGYCLSTRLRFSSRLFTEWGSNPLVDKMICEWGRGIVRFAATVTCRGFVLSAGSQRLSPIVVGLENVRMLPNTDWRR